MQVQRQVVISALDNGHSSFGTFLNEILDRLKGDLLRECDRIASARELNLRREVDAGRNENKQLRSKLQKLQNSNEVPGVLTVSEEAPCTLSKNAAGDSNAVRVATTPQEGTEGLTIVSIDGLEASMLFEDNVDIGTNPKNAPLDLHPEASTSCEHDGQHHVQYWLWEDWEHSNVSLNSVVSDELEEFVKTEVGSSEKEWLEAHALLGSDSVIASRFTVKPTGTLSILWDLIGLLVLMYDVLTIPMRVFSGFEGTWYDRIGWIVIIYWTLDLFLRMLVIGYTDNKGNIQLSRKKIIRHYSLGSFPFDFGMVASDWFSKALGANTMRNVASLRIFRMMRLVRLLRMGKIKRIVRHIEDRIDSEYFSIVCKIVMDVFVILGCCHYLGCLWFLLGIQHVQGYTSWIVDFELENQKWEYQYIVSLHWALAQFTPGASAPKPCNFVEVVFAIFVLVFGMVFIAMFVSGVTQERMRLQALSSKMAKDNWVLRRYLRQHGVSNELIARTVKYVDLVVAPVLSWVKRVDVGLLQYLSKPLQLEVQEEIFYQTLIAHPFLTRLRQRSMALTLHLFVHVVIEVTLAGADLLFEGGGVAHEMYFVSRGALAYMRGGANKAVHIKSGGWCCEPVIWVPWLHLGLAKSTSDCHTISIDSAKLRAAVLEHNEKSFVIKIAHAYLHDLNSSLSSGVIVDDCIRISDNKSSMYSQVLDDIQDF